MKIFHIFFYLVVSTALLSQTVNAQIILTRLGNHPFHQPSLNSISDLLNMVKENKNDIKEGFNKNGISEVFDDFIEILPNAEINKVKLINGTKFEWMLYRKKGVGPLLIAKDIIWINDIPIIAFQFHIDSNGRRYNFAVPLICSNISLRGITGIPVFSSKPKKENIVINPEIKQPMGAESAFTSKPAYRVKPETETKAEKIAINPVKAAVPSAATLGLNFLTDFGYYHQFDPGGYLLARGGFEQKLNENLSTIGLIGVAQQIWGSSGKTALILDLLGEYQLSGSFIELGLGIWFTEGDKDLKSENTQIDFIVALGINILGKPKAFNVSIFLETRNGLGELNSIDNIRSFGRWGGGLRFRF